MTDLQDRHFYTIAEAADITGLSPDGVVDAINSGRMPAERWGDTHRGTRIPRTSLFKTEQEQTSLQVRRLRQLQLSAQRKLEEAQRKEGEAREARAVADRAAQEVSDALALHEIEQAAARRTA